MPGPVQLLSEITCPRCGHARTERMPTEARVHFHECGECGALLKPKADDCCVFCSYGPVRCPPMQRPRAGDA